MTFRCWQSKQLTTWSAFVCKKIRARSRSSWLKSIVRSIRQRCNHQPITPRIVPILIQLQPSYETSGAGSSATQARRRIRGLNHSKSNSQLPFTIGKTYARLSHHCVCSSKRWWTRALWSIIILRLSRVDPHSATWRLQKARLPLAHNSLKEHLTDPIRRVITLSCSSMVSRATLST